jgi:plastocyanin
MSRNFVSFRFDSTSTPALCGLLVALALLFVPPARADERIQAAPPTRYTTPSVTIDQGEPLFFENLDVTGHDVTSKATGPDGNPLFGTPVIDNSEEAFVQGSQYLTTGSYAFFCSIHSNMTGTLNVTSAGTPVPRPKPGAPPPADTTKPKVTVKIRSTRTKRVRRARKLVVEVTLNEAAKVTLKATARFRGRRVTIAKGKVDLTAAGKRRPELSLTRSGRKVLKRRTRLAIRVSARAVDRAGNASTARARRTLKR